MEALVPGTRASIFFGALVAVVVGFPSVDAAAIAAADAPAPSGWLALLHFDPSDGTPTTVDPDFYLVPGRPPDAAAELAAAERLFFDAPELGVICRFPARYEWLRTHREHPSAPSVVELCPSLESRRSERAVLTYASAYAGHAASMFGHLFLTLEDPTHRGLFAEAMDFAAVVPSGDTGLGFALRGLGGGYQGSYLGRPLYERIRRYTHLQGRDLFVYEIALTPTELRLLALHVIELDGIEFPYRFLSENCGLRLLQLVDAARGSTLRGAAGITSAPTGALRELRAAGLITLRELRLAANAEVARLDAELTAEERAVVVTSIEGGALPPRAWLAAHPTATRLLYAWHFDRNKRIAADQATLDALSPFAAPARDHIDGAELEDEPSRSHPYQRASLARTDGGRWMLELSPGFHGLTDDIRGLPRGYAVEALQLRLTEAGGDGVALDRLRVLGLANLPDHRYFDPRPASMFTLDFERWTAAGPVGGEASLLAVRTALGMARRFGEDTVALLGAVELRAGLDGTAVAPIALGPRASWAHQGRRTALVLDLAWLDEFEGQGAKISGGLELVLRTDEQIALVLGASRDPHRASRDEVSLGARVQF